jgi:hypothetical protein
VIEFYKDAPSVHLIVDDETYETEYICDIYHESPDVPAGVSMQVQVER